MTEFSDDDFSRSRVAAAILPVVSRRSAVGLGAAGMIAPAMAVASVPVADPALEFVFEARVTLGAPVEMGARKGERQRFIPITGGTIAGPRLTGTILTGGGDWQTVGDDGLTMIHARYFLRADDGTVIGVDNPGVRTATPAVIAALTAGQDVDPSLYYFRTAPRFDVAAGKYDWLVRNLFVASGIRRVDHVVIRVFRVT